MCTEVRGKPGSACVCAEVRGKRGSACACALLLDYALAAWDVEARHATATATLAVANNGESFSVYTNWNNMSDYLITPAE